MHSYFTRSKLLRCAAASIALSACAHAMADDCDVIKKAAGLSEHAPGFRQFLTVAGRPERLMSVTKGDTVYLALGPGQWNKMPRAEFIASAAEVERTKKYAGCKVVGNETVDGVAAKIYEYSWALGESQPKMARVWIGDDGLVHKQALSDRGAVRYEYKDVKAPQ